MALLELSGLKAALKPGQRLLGLDLGEKTIGLALSDTGLAIATPFKTLGRGKFKTDAAALLALARELDIGGLVVGFPINMDGTEGPSAQSARAFTRNWTQISEMPVALVDERLSTAAVTRALIEADTSRRRRAELVDRLAASYILQGALDRIRRL